MSKILPLIAGSEDRIEGWAFDNVEGVLQAIDLSGADIKLRFSIDERTTVERTATADGNQVANKGKFTYDLVAADITTGGTVRFCVKVTQGGQTHISQEIVRSAKVPV